MAYNYVKEEMVIALFLERLYPEFNIYFRAVSEFYTVLVFNL